MTSAMALEVRARQSLGASSDAIHQMVADAVERHNLTGATMIDVGCGHGALRARLGDRFSLYRGLDAVRYSGFPADGLFTQVDLDAEQWGVEPQSADLVAAIETIEHLENPWSFMRHLSALAPPGGCVMVTTPNQLSVLSLLTLVTKHMISSFSEVKDSAHRTSVHQQRHR